MNDSAVPFARRFGVTRGRIVDDDFPLDARMALRHVLGDLVGAERVESWTPVLREVERLARVSPSSFEYEHQREDRAWELMKELPWERVFELVERIHAKFLRPTYVWINANEQAEDLSLDTVRAEFAAEVNQVLLEENFAFEFRDGRFYRPGGLQLQRASSSAHKVLARPELKEAREHFLKAVRFYDGAVGADYPNAAKEAVSALEAAIKGLFPDKKENDCRRILRQLTGPGEEEVPPTLANVAEQVYAFRGAATAVAHGGAQGGTVTPEVAELVMSLVASYITYLASLSDRLNEELPF